MSPGKNFSRCVVVSHFAFFLLGSRHPPPSRPLGITGRIIVVSASFFVVFPLILQVTKATGLGK